MSGRAGRGNPDRGGINPPQRDIEELLRKAVNLVRHGVVEEVDPKRRMARVRIGNAEIENGSFLTNWLRISSDRAGTTSMSRQLSKGEQVMVFSPDGRTENGVIGASIHNETNESPSDREDLGLTVYPDGTKIGYDDKDGIFTAELPGGSFRVKVGSASMTLTESGFRVSAGGVTWTFGSGGISAEASSINIVSSELLHNGTNIGDDHRHTGVRSGSERTGEPE